MKYDVLTIEGSLSKEPVLLPKKIFEANQHSHLVWLAVKQYLAAQRQGTHKTKEKSEVTASTRKVQKQKGTGNARRGSLKSNILRGGGTTFGPKPRDYRLKMNAHSKRMAKRVVFTQFAQQKELVVVEKFPNEIKKTKEILAWLKKIKVAEHKTLLILHQKETSLLRSVRNLPKVATLSIEAMNIYALLKAERIVCSAEAIPLFEKYLV